MYEVLNRFDVKPTSCANLLSCRSTCYLNVKSRVHACKDLAYGLHYISLLAPLVVESMFLTTLVCGRWCRADLYLICDAMES